MAAATADSDEQWCVTQLQAPAPYAYRVESLVPAPTAVPDFHEAYGSEGDELPLVGNPAIEREPRLVFDDHGTRLFALMDNVLYGTSVPKAPRRKPKLLFGVDLGPAIDRDAPAGRRVRQLIFVPEEQQKEGSGAKGRWPFMPYLILLLQQRPAPGTIGLAAELPQALLLIDPTSGAVIETQGGVEDAAGARRWRELVPLDRTYLGLGLWGLEPHARLVGIMRAHGAAAIEIDPESGRVRGHELVLPPARAGDSDFVPATVRAVGAHTRFEGRAAPARILTLLSGVPSLNLLEHTVPATPPGAPLPAHEVRLARAPAASGTPPLEFQSGFDAVRALFVDHDRQLVVVTSHQVLVFEAELAVGEPRGPLGHRQANRPLYLLELGELGTRRGVAAPVVGRQQAFRAAAYYPHAPGGGLLALMLDYETVLLPMHDWLPVARSEERTRAGHPLKGRVPRSEAPRSVVFTLLMLREHGTSAAWSSMSQEMLFQVIADL